MTNEIKEILELLKEDLYIPQEDNREYKLLDKGDDKLLIDYITNLQEELEEQKRIEEADFKSIQELEEENERLKELVNPTTQIFIDTQDMEERYGQELYEDYLKEQLEDYKSRCEKASEFIRFIAFNSERPLTITELNKVYNILQGVGKDE